MIDRHSHYLMNNVNQELLINELDKQNKYLRNLTNQLQDRINELSFLQEVLNNLIKSHDPEGTIKAILDMAITITGSEAGYVMLKEANTNKLKIISFRGEFNQYINDFFQQSHYILQMCSSPEITLLSQGNSVFDLLNKKDKLLRSLMAVPLRTEHITIGLIILMHRHCGQENHSIEYTEKQSATIKEFAGQAALILDSTLLKIEKGKKDAYLKSIIALSSAIDAKDSYTRNHSRNVTRYSYALGRQLGLSPKELLNIQYGSILHDIGKIGIPDAILNKAGRLSADEYNKIKEHPLIGANILAPMDFLQDAIKIVRHHHERYGGNGYPDGIKGESIPYGARIVSIADSWDAMTSNRSYRRAMTQPDSIRELQEGAGEQFDPPMVKCFIQLIKENII
ncbi:MAG: HD domain-containing phosphohydrolase [Bacillota bacterium]